MSKIYNQDKHVYFYDSNGKFFGKFNASFREHNVSHFSSFVLGKLSILIELSERLRGIPKHDDCYVPDGYELTKGINLVPVGKYIVFESDGLECYKYADVTTNEYGGVWASIKNPPVKVDIDVFRKILELTVDNQPVMW